MTIPRNALGPAYAHAENLLDNAATLAVALDAYSAPGRSADLNAETLNYLSHNIINARSNLERIFQMLRPLAEAAQAGLSSLPVPLETHPNDLISSAEAEVIAVALRYQATDMQSNILARHERVIIDGLLKLANQIDDRAQKAALLWPAQPPGDPAE